MNRNHIPTLPPPEVAAGNSLRRLLFVCDGNICRSPLALAFLRRHLAGGRRLGWDADSAGLVAGDGDVPLVPTCAAAREAGIELDGHRARPLAPDRDRPSLALIMEERQRPKVMRITGLPGDRVLMLGAFAAIAGGPAIADPFGGTAATYRECVRQIKVGVEGLVRWLEQPPAR
jgi:protein-tyrosine phosphatase